MTRLSRLLNTGGARLFLAPLTLLIIAGLTVSAGCGGKKKKKKEIRAEKGEAKLTEVMDARRKKLISKMPASDDGSGNDHPWLEWVGKSAGSVSKSEFRKVGVLAKGTKTADTGKALARWLEAQKKFYWDQKLGPKEYYREMSIAADLAKGKSYEQDLDFDRIFFHAAQAARDADMFSESRGPEDDRVTHFFTYWKYIWGFKPETSFFQEETNKLCNEKLGDYCDKIPMELRPYQVMKPYYDKVIELVGAFDKKYPGSPYKPFTKRLVAAYEKRKKAVPGWKEWPVLPGIRSTIGAPVGGNAVLWITEKGIVLMDNVLRKLDTVPKPATAPVVVDEKSGEARPIKGFKMPKAPTDPWKPDWKRDADLELAIRVLVEDVRSTTVSQFNQSQVLIVPRAEVPVAFIRGLMGATILGEHAKEWPTMMLVGRRREDGSNKRCGYKITLLADDKHVPFKLKAPGTKKAAKCTAWAVIGEEAYEAKGFQPAVWHDGKKVWTGKLGNDGELRSPIGQKGHGEGDRLEKWADQQSSTIVVAVPENATYQQWLEALNGVALRCEPRKNLPPRCKKGRVNPVFVATCPAA